MAQRRGALGALHMDEFVAWAKQVADLKRAACSKRVTDLAVLVTLMPDAVDEAHEWIGKHPEDGTADRISAVSELVTGFASAYGVELLATVHWAATREAAGLSADPAVLTELIGSWNKRKGRLFTLAHVGKAMSRLKELGWIGQSSR